MGSTSHASIEQRPDQALVEGFDVAWVRDQATYWWSKGFEQDSSFELFRTLLDEMAGLGVLRKTGGDRYALRSSNVLGLLGSAERIQQALLDVTQHIPPPEYDAGTFRRSRRDDPWERSPLTAQQEADLLLRENGVATLFGSALSGLDRVTEFLGEICEPTLVSLADLTMDYRRFQTDLKRIDADRPEGLFLYVVRPVCGWNEKWVEHAVEFLEPKKRSQKRFFRILFLGDSRLAWEWGEGEEERLRTLWDRGVRELALQPWREPALRRWMLDAGFGPFDNQEGYLELVRATGGWDALVLEFGARCRASSYNWTDHLKALESSWPGDPAWMERFGFIPAASSILGQLAELNEPVTIAEAADVLGLTDDLSRLTRALNWADRLQYARRGSQGKWQLDEVIRQAVLIQADR